MLDGMTPDMLRECLAAIQPVDLLGMRLLQSCPQQGMCSQSTADIPRETLKEAVCEIVEYTEQCRGVAQRLSHLEPIPLTTIDIGEIYF